ncbi:UNVERIFIED_CONTAM: hypothetical protein FKN15_034435 [Acipenser sinensis]
MGQVQHGRGGLGLSSATPTWHKAAPAQQRKLIVNEVQKQEERMRCIKAVSIYREGECGTTQDRLARPMDNGTDQDQFPHQTANMYREQTLKASTNPQLEQLPGIILCYCQTGFVVCLLFRNHITSTPVHCKPLCHNELKVTFLKGHEPKGSFILSIPIIIYQKIQEGYWYGPRSYCMEQFPSETHQRVFILYQFMVVYLLPLITISLCYSLMLKRVGQPVVEPVDNNYQIQLLSQRTIAMRSKISKMVVVIVLLFTICWGPIQLFILFQSFYPNFQANYATYKIKTWANCMSYANSSINPIVYGFMGASFRKSFKKAFPFMFRRKAEESTSALTNGRYSSTDDSAGLLRLSGPKVTGSNGRQWIQESA